MTKPHGTESSRSWRQDLRTDLSDRPIWCLALLWAVFQIWLVKYPPMIDFPQHVAQVALLQDLVTGRSSWSHEFWINVKTPYLIGYGLSFLLATVVTPLVAMKAVLTVAAAAFLFGAWSLRRVAGADRSMDWMAVAAFTGFAYHWGFVTFLVASPILLAFVLLLHHVCRTERPALPSVALAAVGVGLLLAHGLMFVFAWCLAGAMLLVNLPRQRFSLWLVRAWPLLAMAVCAMVYFYIARSTEQTINGGVSTRVDVNLNPINRIRPLLTLALDHKSGSAVMLMSMGLLAAPWLMGLRPVMRLNHPAVVFFAVTLGFLLVVPGSLMDTGFVYERFAVFFFPAYGCLFMAGGGTALRWQAPRRFLAVALMFTVTALVCAHRTHVARTFDAHMKGLDAILAVAEPGQRMVYLPLEEHLDPRREDNLFVHTGAYYQAMNHGLVDFNFAWFAPQIVRFRPEHRPAIKVGFEWAPEKFDWVAHQGDRYRLFLFRGGKAADHHRLLGRPNCDVRLQATEGQWFLYEVPPCKP